jgi:hypothetical protein
MNMRTYFGDTTLARVFIEQELGVPTRGKIWDEHLYELAGFKDILGETLKRRLLEGESIPLHEFPSMPRLTLRLLDRRDNALFHDLPFRIYACAHGVLFLGTDIQIQPLYALLVLDFTKEELTFDLDNFGFVGPHTRSDEIHFREFLVEYFRNGELEIYSEERRISHKLAFIPMNVDMVRTLDNWRRHIAQVGGWPLRSWDFTQKRFQQHN